MLTRPTVEEDFSPSLPTGLALKPEPSKEAANSCTLRFILPDNRKLQRNFFLDETLAHVAHYLRHQPDIPSSKFRLMHGRPPCDLQEKKGATTLGQLGMRNDVVRVDYD